jgi:thiol-disulfide isomerase/thioredoxin
MISKKLIILLIWPILTHFGFSQEIGKPFLDFTSVTSAGQQFKLSDLTGKVIFLDFWASWCVPCKEEFPFLIKLYNEYKDSGFVVVAVNVDTDRRKLDKFINNLGVEVPFTVVTDFEQKIPSLYNLEAMPTSFLIDKNGIIKFKHTGFESSDKEKYTNDITELINEK